MNVCQQTKEKVIYWFSTNHTWAIGNQHAQTRAFYVSIISALLVFLSYVSSTNPAVQNISTPGQIAVTILGIILCIAWYIHTVSIGKLYRAKFDLLREMETELAVEVFKKEWAKLSEYNYTVFTRIESFVSLALAVPFAILLIFILS